MNDRFDSVQRVDFIKDICRGKRVLHLGCTNAPYTQDSIQNGTLLHLELEKIAVELHGFDYEVEALEMLERAGSKNLRFANLERLDEIETDETFDVIVGGEIIEHLSNPGLFLGGIRRFMAPTTDLVLTTINAYCAMRFLIYGARGKRGRREPVHPDHVSYYSFTTLKLLLDRHDLELREFHFYDLGREHRPFSPWYYNLFNDVCVRIAPQLSDGIVAVAKLN